MNKTQGLSSDRELDTIKSLVKKIDPEDDDFTTTSIFDKLKIESF